MTVDLLRTQVKDPRLPDRFWAKVQATADGCWQWIGGKVNAEGYGSFWWQARAGRAHVVAYQVLREPVPAGFELDHLCRNTSCVNPDHLEPVTHRVNVLRGASPTAQLAASDTCGKGHPLAGDNLRIEGGARRCRTCLQARTGHGGPRG